MKQNNKKPQLNPETIRRLFTYITNGYKLRFFLVLICILIGTMANVAGAAFIKTVIDSYIEPMLKPPFSDLFPELLKACAIMAMVYIFGIISTFLYNRIMVTIGQGVLKKIRNDMFFHMQKLPVKYFDTHAFGDVMSRYTNDVDTLRQMISMSIPQAIASVMMIVSVTVAMLIINIPLTVLVFLCVFLMLVSTRKITGNSTKYFIQQQGSIGSLNGYIEEMINGQKVVKVFCHEDFSKKEFDAKNEELFSQSAKANTFANILMPVMGNIGNLQYVLIALVGGALAINNIGGITIGAIASFLTLARNFAQPIGQISMQLNSIIMALAGAGRIFELLDEQPETDEGYVTLVNAKYENGILSETPERTGLWAWKHPHKSDGSITYAELKGKVELFDVDFGYTEDKKVLHNIKIHANPGQKIAFVGATGAGKTTITNLLNRFYDIADGKIRIDDININKIRKSDLRRSLGVVLQETNLFTGTIWENIRFGKPDATDDEVLNAARLANAHDFIMLLPDGYDTVISGDGGSLSQGQRQLLSIARAAVADPPVMILDEATSSIDTRTEAIVQKGMDSLMEGRTVFVIAHRLSTIQNSNAIMVMEHGKIIERGNHEQLLSEKGKYYQLFTGGK